MNRFPEKCREYADSRRYAVAEENGKKFTLDNQRNCFISKYRVDGCFDQNTGEQRCDFLFTTAENVHTAYFVELKGGALKKAVEQITATILFLKPQLPNCVYKARIIGSRDVPNLKTTTAYRTLLGLLKSESHFHYATNRQYSEII